MVCGDVPDCVPSARQYSSALSLPGAPGRRDGVTVLFMAHGFGRAHGKATLQGEPAHKAGLSTLGREAVREPGGAAAVGHKAVGWGSPRLQQRAFVCVNGQQPASVALLPPRHKEPLLVYTAAQGMEGTVGQRSVLVLCRCAGLWRMGQCEVGMGNRT